MANLQHGCSDLYSRQLLRLLMPKLCMVTRVICNKVGWIFPTPFPTCEWRTETQKPMFELAGCGRLPIFITVLRCRVLATSWRIGQNAIQSNTFSNCWGQREN